MLADLNAALLLHVLAALVALLAGTWLITAPKGTRSHRQFGYAYLSAMALVLLGAAGAPATFMPFFESRFGFFHIFLLIGTVSMIVGLRALYRWRRYRDVRALHAHQVHLSYSYAGLLMAGLSQIATNPRFGLITGGSAAAFWISFGAVNIAIYAVAVWLIQTRVARQMRLPAADPGRV